MIKQQFAILEKGMDLEVNIIRNMMGLRDDI